MPLPRHPQVARWLQDLDDPARAEVDISEVRVDIDDGRVYRVLVGFGPDDVPALLLAGNKAGIGNRWYEENVPVADERFDTYLKALTRSATSTEKPR